MLIWFLCWLITDFIFLATLSSEEYHRLLYTKRGVIQIVKYAPLRLFLWPFLLIAILVDLIEILSDTNRLNFWWFNINDIQL